MNRKDFTTVKRDSYPANMSNREKAKRDKKKVKKSPGHNKKQYKYYDKEKRLWMFADKKSVLKNMIEDINKK